jgi:hypothetical protein
VTVQSGTELLLLDNGCSVALHFLTIAQEGDRKNKGTARSEQQADNSNAMTVNLVFICKTFILRKQPTTKDQSSPTRSSIGCKKYRQTLPQ